MESMALLLNEEQVRALLPMADLIDAMEQALAAYSSGQVEQPVRSVVDVGQDRADARLRRLARAGARRQAGDFLYVQCEARVAHTTSRRSSCSIPETGELQAVLDGRYLTEARTAAVSAVSARWLARKDSKRLAIIGSGVQAHSHLEALKHVFEFERVTVWSPTRFQARGVLLVARSGGRFLCRRGSERSRHCCCGDGGARTGCDGRMDPTRHAPDGRRGVPRQSSGA